METESKEAPQRLVRPEAGQSRLRTNEKGMALVFVGMGLMALMSVTVLSVDVGMVVTARNQAQNSADAGALAGALSLLYDDYNDKSESGPAVQNALAGARTNAVMSQTVSITPGDVTFPTPNRVRVEVFRTGARANPVTTLVARYFGIPVADITATATAEAAPSNAQTCVKPFIIPDKWIEMQTPPWDIDDTFDMYDKKGKLLANPDIYVPVGESGYTGYNQDADKGMLIRIKASNGTKISPSIYFPFRLGNNSGADDYRWSIENCNTTRLYFGEEPEPETGNMTGPTAQAIQALIAQDEGAYWDEDNKKPVSNMHPSPRVGRIPVFDPPFYEGGKHTGNNADFKIANFIGIFIVGMQGNDVIARITPVGGLIDGSAGPAPVGAFPKTIRLVQ